MASSVGWTVAVAEAETRSTRSPEPSAGDEREEEAMTKGKEKRGNGRHLRLRTEWQVHFSLYTTHWHAEASSNKQHRRQARRVMSFFLSFPTPLTNSIQLKQNNAQATSPSLPFSVSSFTASIHPSSNKPPFSVGEAMEEANLERPLL